MGFIWRNTDENFDNIAKEALIVLHEFYLSTGSTHCHFSYPTTTTVEKYKKVGAL